MNNSELERYSRQLLVPGFELEGQEVLSSASVLIVGCGGLGALAAQYLAAAGIGRLALVDPDRIELSNLPRQIAYIEDDVGRFKAEALAERLGRMNSTVTVTHHPISFDETSGSSLLTAIDAVVDGTDSQATRLVIDRLTAQKALPWFMGAAVQMAGQNIAFTGSRDEGCYHCLAPQQTSEAAGGCATLGILGPVVATVALRQVLDVLGALTGVAKVPWGRLRQYDFRTDTTASLPLPKRAGCRVCDPDVNTR
ncbi:MAG: HesA/MoeB/ThiF family protein [Luminiphilus sp.]|nr:HesA/MoeB/ThiF family protein [Luminiphilus sp.]